ncbi:Type 1 glutamine amidotransferase-like domain-containing protein [Aliirhizobium terrae]|uniref:Type 1 glutamine amidotransferase-like domain-containing protein n=1 Tax=Terrirhizobium terrae TaxID=2926709 RepID=UPI0025753DA7|nr:Type 1 glutamine amidotransferase-like domain-containing protein [Rhizobium sp. CC-CFT758]WJH39018.1 Type 1 glutamine amidotransferase-like domain-containing protein [Rhizobium sp. CC-CFT758]
MVNLALYSDQIIPENSAIDARLIALMQSLGLGTRLGYVPSDPEPSRRFFTERKDYYRRIGLDLSLFHDPDDTTGMDALLACDAIHLSGGHTGGFLARLRRVGMVEPLREWTARGGVLIGTSAGAILMTPTIAVDALFSDSRPEDIRDGEALNLLPFEFFPHLNGKPNFLPDLVRYSKATPRPIIACNDGDGLIVSAGQVELIGNPLWIADGATKEARQIEPSLLKTMSA